MNGFLIDTNVVSELRKGDRKNPGVVNWFDEAGEDVWLSVLVIAELRRGTELTRRRDPAGGAALSAWLDGIVDDFADRVLPISIAIAWRWGEIGIPDAVPAIDGLIAATAIEHDLTVVTRNLSDLERAGAMCVNPFS